MKVGKNNPDTFLVCPIFYLLQDGCTYIYIYIQTKNIWINTDIHMSLSAYEYPPHTSLYKRMHAAYIRISTLAPMNPSSYARTYVFV